MALQQRGDRSVVLRGKERAGDVDDPSTGTHERRRPIENRCLLRMACGEAPGAQAPFGVGIAPPCPGAGTGRVDHDAIDQTVEIGQHIRPLLAAARGAHLGLRTGAAQSLMNWGEAARIAIRGDEPSGIAGGCGQGEGLSAATRAKIDDRFARFGARQKCGELRALVLNLVPAFEELGFHVQGWAAPVGADRHA